MSVSSSTSTISYAGNGSTSTAYTVPFNFFDTTDLNVYVVDSAGTSTLLRLTTNYTVSGGNGSTGSVTTTSAIPSAKTVLIQRVVPYTQLTSFKTGDRLPSDSIENALDKLTMETQQLSRNALPDTAATSGSAPYVLGVSTSGGNPTWVSQTASAIADGAITAAKIAPITATGSTTARSLQGRFADIVNVKDFGAKGDGITDDSFAFTAALTSLPAGGGKVVVPNGTYKINTAPAWGTKSIYWDIDVNAVFTGTATGTAGSFGTIATNTGNVAAGPWVQSQTTQAPSFSEAAVNAATFEMLAPSSVTTGQYVALYAGASGSAASTNNNVWAVNTLVEAKSGATGAYFGLEIDVISNSLPAITKGICITGHGTQDADVAVEIDRNTTIGSGVWFYGVTTKSAYNSIFINVDSYLSKGISFSNSSTFANTLFSGKQFANNTPAVVLQRYTDTSPTGTFVQCVNAANSSVLASVDVAGTVFAAAGVYTNGGFLRVNNAGNTATCFNATATSLQIPVTYTAATTRAYNGTFPVQDVNGVTRYVMCAV
jgi:hypothetical protein